MSELEDWLAQRPESVKRLAAEFPVGTVVHTDFERLYLLGYTESDALIMSPIDPTVDYESTKQKKVYICAEHLRGI